MNAFGAADDLGGKNRKVGFRALVGCAPRLVLRSPFHPNQILLLVLHQNFHYGRQNLLLLHRKSAGITAK